LSDIEIAVFKPVKLSVGGVVGSAPFETGLESGEKGED